MSKDKLATKTMQMTPLEMVVLRDFQLAANHLNEAMGRYLGNIGVEKHGLIDKQPYQFQTDWKTGIVSVRKIVLPKPPVKLEK